MKDICQYEDCTGCMACYNVCKHDAITIVQNEEGFYIPQIDQDKCVDCAQCYKKCPVNKDVKRNNPIRIYSGWIKDDKLRMDSSSGGAFTSLAIPILKNNGVVFGVALNKEMKVEHTYIEKIEDLEALRGSKYVQSNIKNTYRQVKYFLKMDRKVLFSGTPCQVAGLKNYLNYDYANLLTVDLVCHGVPSPRIFEDWKSWFMMKNKLLDMTLLKFRSKKKSWIFFNMEIEGKNLNGDDFYYIGEYYKDAWIRGFLRDYFLRTSCYQCRYTSISRCSDFTIADWWGYQPSKNESKDFESKGVSLIMCNTIKADDYFLKNCKGNMVLRERTIEEAYKTNRSLKESFKKPEKRSQFWKDYFLLPFNEVVRKYMQSEKLPIYMWFRVYMKPSLIRKVLCFVFYKIYQIVNLK